VRTYHAEWSSIEAPPHTLRTQASRGQSSNLKSPVTLLPTSILVGTRKLEELQSLSNITAVPPQRPCVRFTTCRRRRRRSAPRPAWQPDVTVPGCSACLLGMLMGHSTGSEFVLAEDRLGRWVGRRCHKLGWARLHVGLRCILGQ
jgi:hypothetical protein